MNEPQNPSPRSRLQALLAIPDNQRTEDQWDELHELEITLAPGNRIGQQEKQNPLAGPGKSGGGGRGGPMGNPRGGPKGAPRGENRGENRGGGRGGQMPRQANNGQRKPADAPQAEGAPVEGGAEISADGAPAKKPFRRFHKKPPKPAES